ncbi:MAG: ABC transporter substrate-binding protein [Bacteroidetes bacterium]|nr:ABC transporter substrate-binding protein [Bacteroidota bacterium]
MKQSFRTSARAIAVLLLVALVGAGCGKSGGSKSGSSAQMKDMSVTLPKQFNVPPGADPSVPAGLGGAGFEKVAADSGWQTVTLSPEESNLIADSNAKKGGDVTTSMVEYPATFRAYGKDENTTETRAIYGLVYESLLGTNPLTLDYLPSLATHWKVGADGQTFYYRINPEARFSDGHPVTTEDVLASYKLGKDPGILDPYTNTFYDGFDPPVAISKYIVSVRSKTKNWKNMFYFAGRPILPAHIIGNLSGKEYLEKYQYEMPTGSGPYVVLNDDIKKGNSVTLTRRADWWAKDQPIYKYWNNFDKIKFVVVRDENLRLEKFFAGEYDFYYVNRASYWIEKFKDNDLVKRGIIQRRKIYNDKPTGFGGIAFNTQREPFTDQKVRQAFTLLFNRKDLVEKLMYNEYVLSDSYYPNSVYANPSNPKQEYDPTKAAQLLAEAGYTSRNGEGILMKNGQPLVVEMLVTADQIRIVTPYQQELQKAGIKVNFRQVDNTSIFKMTLEKNFTMTFQQWGGIVPPNPISSFHSRLAGPNSNNITGFKNARADQIMEQEQVTFDQPTRVKLIRELDSILVASNQYALAYHVPFVRIAYWNKFGVPNFTLGRVSDYDEALFQWWYDPEKAAQAKKGATDKSVTMEVGATDVMFWPEWDKKYPDGHMTPPPAQPQAAPAKAGGKGDSSKPSLK